MYYLHLTHVVEFFTVLNFRILLGPTTTTFKYVACTRVKFDFNLFLQLDLFALTVLSLTLVSLNAYMSTVFKRIT